MTPVSAPAAVSAAVVHPSAIVEPGVTLGDGTRVWDAAHVRGPATVLGRDCIVGGKTYIAYGVTIGDRCKINSACYVCTAVTIGTGVFVGAGTVFTNDRFPRAATPELDALLPSDPDESTLPTVVEDGVTLGARTTIGCGLTIGRFAMVGMASTVTADVPAFHLVVGTPARTVGVVCRCGLPVLRVRAGDAVPDHDRLACACGRSYRTRGGLVTELEPTADPAGSAA